MNRFVSGPRFRYRRVIGSNRLNIVRGSPATGIKGEGITVATAAIRHMEYGNVLILSDGVLGVCRVGVCFTFHLVVWRLRSIFIERSLVVKRLLRLVVRWVFHLVSVPS